MAKSICRFICSRKDFTEDRKVGGGPGETLEIFWQAPKKSLVLHGVEYSSDNPAMKRQQSNGFFIILPNNRYQRRADFDVDGQFLPQFSHEGGLRGFTQLHLATWKFPEPTQMFSLRTKAGQKATFQVLNHAANHINHLA